MGLGDCTVTGNSVRNAFFLRLSEQTLIKNRQNSESNRGDKYKNPVKTKKNTFNTQVTLS